MLSLRIFTYGQVLLLSLPLERKIKESTKYRRSMIVRELRAVKSVKRTLFRGFYPTTW